MLSNPQVISVEAGQDVSLNVSLGSSNITGWTFTATLRASLGGTPIVTKTVGSGIVVNTVSPGSISVNFTATETNQTPGHYIWEVLRSNSGYVYPVVEPSAFIIRSSASSANPSLTNLSEVQAYLQLGTISDNETGFYLQLISAAEAAIKRICGRSFNYSSYTEYLDGNGLYHVMVKETPVASVTSLYLDTTGYYGQGPDAFSADKLQVAGSDYFLAIDDTNGMSNAGRIGRINRAWPNSLGFITHNGTPRITPMPLVTPGCIKVTYMGGYQMIPSDLKQAVFQIVADRRGAFAQGEKIVGGGFEGYTFALGATDDEIKRIGSIERTLHAYKRTGIFIS